MVEMPERKFPDKMEWTDPPRGYYLSEVKEKVLNHNSETGAKIALIKAPKGIMDKLHKHPEANQYTLVLTGANKWTFSYTPKGEVHGGSDVKNETTALFIWDGPPKPEVIE
jgi:quercetin dioxygenase-like cupin family protein